MDDAAAAAVAGSEVGAAWPRLAMARAERDRIVEALRGLAYCVQEEFVIVRTAS